MFTTIGSSLNKIANSRGFLALHRSLSAKTSNVAIVIHDKTGIATVTMQKAPLNSISKDFFNELGNVVDDLEKEKCRGMILTSATKVFSAGLDFNEFQATPEKFGDFMKTVFINTLKLYETTFPTVSVINGYAPAGGCLLAMTTQYRIMLKNSKIGYNETKFGLTLSSSFVSMFENVVGIREAELALCLGKLYDTEEALRVGLVDEVVGDRYEGLEKAEKFLLEYQKVDAHAATITKLLCRKKVIEEFRENAQKEVDFFLTLLSGPEVQNTIKRYLKSLKTQKKL